MGWTLIRRASLTPVPWPNNRGITRDYVVRPGLRITLAELTEDAPFSALPGVERVFTLSSGGPVELTVDGVASRCERWVPFRFSGGAVTTCRMLDGGTAEAFNVFYEPPLAAASVFLVRDATLPGPGERFLFSPAPGTEVDGLPLGAGDLLVGSGAGRVRGTVLAVEAGIPS